MKKILLNYRYYILALLATVMVIGIISEPIESLSNGLWLIVLIASKVIGLGAGYAIYRLINHWERLGQIPEISNI